MNPEQYTDTLICTHKMIMEQINAESPPLKLKAKLISQEQNRYGVHAVFQVISTSSKTKINTLIEEKLFLDNTYKLKGTVIDAYDNKIVLNISKKLKGEDFELIRDSNYNNEILLQKAKQFLESKKEVHESLYLKNGSGRQASRERSDSNKNTKSESKNEDLERVKNHENGEESNSLDPKNTENDNVYLKVEKDQSDNLKEIIEEYENEYFNKSEIAEAIERVSDLKIESKTDSANFFFFNQFLNQSQKRAVEFSLDRIPFKILGPPGTGKTETVVEIICQFLHMKKTVLVCGPSNLSVDNIIDKFCRTRFYKENSTSFYRLGSSTKGLVHYNLEAMADEAVNFMDKDQRKSLKKSSGKQNEKKEFYKSKNEVDKQNNKNLRKVQIRDKSYLNNDEVTTTKDVNSKRKEFILTKKRASPLVFATLFSSLKETFYFDICIVDEACQATELECFMGIVKAKSFILAGDPNQLCPDYPSLYEKVNLPCLVLKEQYRMHKDIIDFSNSYFYKNLIISNKDDPHTFFGQSKILFIDTSFFDFNEEDFESSKINKKEAETIIQCAWWISEKFEGSSIGVIVPYSAQAALIRSRVENISNCSANTVDGFQGQERDFIILGLVRSNEECVFGFLSNEKRLNVAITRCKKGLVIIGDSENFRHSSFFRHFFEHLNNSAYVVDPDTFKLIMND